MSTILVQFVAMSCKLMIIPMRTGRCGKRRLKKRGKALQMPFVVVNTCMFKLDFINTRFVVNKCDNCTYRCDFVDLCTLEVTERNSSLFCAFILVLDLAHYYSTN